MNNINNMAEKNINNRYNNRVNSMNRILITGELDE
jgi:hypothetical protein